MSIYNHEEVKKRASLVQRYKTNEIIYQEMDFCDSLGIILSGEVKLTHFTQEGKEIVLATLSENHLFGDFLIFSSDPYFPGHLIATKESRVVFINKNNVQYLIKHYPPFNVYFLSQLSDKAVHLNMHNKLLNLSNLREKITFYLEKNHSKLKNHKVFIHNKTRFAQYLNVQRPSLSRELSAMKKSKIIDYDRNYIWFTSNN